jgi:hypothetical protein
MTKLPDIAMVKLGYIPAFLDVEQIARRSSDNLGHGHALSSCGRRQRWGQLIVKVSEQQTDEVFQRSDALDVFVKGTHIQFLLQLRLRRFANADPVMA